MKSVIRLFKAVPIERKGKGTQNKKILEETIKRGFIFSPDVLCNYSESELYHLIQVISNEIGLTPEQMNASFHKNWGKIKDAPLLQLVMEQIVHYITTYGFESLGVYDENSVYIPNEKLEIPGINTDKIKLVVIKGYTKGEIKEKIMKLLSTGIALGEETVKDIMDVATFVGLRDEDVNKNRNKEVRVMLYEYLNLFPEDPIEFLRFCIYMSINKTLLIKDKETIEEIKSKDNFNVLRLFEKYKKKHGLGRLSEIFYRFKPLFLAFRTNTGMKRYTNKIRKLAIKYHRPLTPDFLNDITAIVGSGQKINSNLLVKELKKANTFRKIRLAYALKFRIKNQESILYRIRNGKGYAKDFYFRYKNEAKRVMDIIVESIVNDVKKNVEGKRIYIPDYVNYSLPATEKQFTGNFPSGSYITIPNDMVFGIHWENVNGNRIDLDLSMLSPESGKMGWDGNYRNANILFSGDMTDAKDGASELFYVNKRINQNLIMFVNYYNFDKDIEVPFKILVAKEDVKELDKNYMVNPDNVLAVTKSKICVKQKILGLFVGIEKECRFYFVETSIGKSITSSNNVFIKHARKYLFDFYEDMIDLRSILEAGGAVMVGNIDDCDINLSPECLEKHKIINLLYKT